MRDRRWILVAAHHPLLATVNGGDSAPLASRWGPLLKRYGVDFYISGHDHGLQHLQLENWPITFVVSGAGGAKLQHMRRDDRGPFSPSAHGFLHLQFAAEEATCRFIKSEWRCALPLYPPSHRKSHRDYEVVDAMSPTWKG